MTEQERVAYWEAVVAERRRLMTDEERARIQASVEAMLAYWRPTFLALSERIEKRNRSLPVRCRVYWGRLRAWLRSALSYR